MWSGGGGGGPRPGSVSAGLPLAQGVSSAGEVLDLVVHDCQQPGAERASAPTAEANGATGPARFGPARPAAGGEPGLRQGARPGPPPGPSGTERHGPERAGAIERSPAHGGDP